MAVKRQKLIHPSIFLNLHGQVISKVRQVLEAQNEELGSGIGASFYGFYGYDGDPLSIKGVMMEDKEVKIYLQEYIKKYYGEKSVKYSYLENGDLADKVISGKYLYDRNREARKSLQSIKLADEYIDLYAVFVGCSSLKEFVETRCGDLEPSLVKDQLQMLRVDAKRSSVGPSASFIGYYYSYRDDLIKKFLLEIKYNSGKAIQTGFHFRSGETIYKPGDEMNIDPSTIYSGKLSQAGNSALAITLTGKENDKKNYMSLIMYTGGMNIQEMTLVRGHLQTVSAHGYIFSAEIFFVRVTDDISVKGRLLSPNYDFDEAIASKVSYVKKYLYLQRRTSRIPQDTEQDIKQVRAKGNTLDLLEPMVGTWKIWGVDRNYRVIQSKLVVKQDYSARLFVYGINGIEEQVCLFRVSKDRNGINVWISAHQQKGIELKNIALLEMPSVYSKNMKIVEGTSTGVGVRRVKFAMTPLVFIKTDAKDSEFQPTILNETSLMAALFSTNQKENHQEAYCILENRVKEKNLSKSIISFTELRQSKLGMEGNLNYDG